LLAAQCIDESTAPLVTKDMLIHDCKLLLGPALQILSLFKRLASKQRPKEPAEVTDYVVVPDNFEKGEAQWSTLAPVESIEQVDELIDNSTRTNIPGIEEVATSTKTSCNYDPVSKKK
jgi:hypothetical protein